MPEGVKDPATLRFQDVFGNFYQYFLSVHERSEFTFLREEFETFVVVDWKDLVRGQHRSFSVATRKKFR